ncbi:signal recognition particle-docking protein FtsY [Corynebacterium sp. FDAARGOS 1242]|uniref:signal recognition particle-docking protein FtsY n=1 Tax=Corynebacterium sp. FDAARGOS 1242 TaxID=2778078 RepID=UPI00194E9263|nr:signal recognition particle-docking protein FtsY [Corynebacterium sp. FDAARGOS 1242]QRP98516.1 signal recognition particle-docking protein FtsY [Corynebacterium sp. FDAARGOS 1242]
MNTTYLWIAIAVIVLILLVIGLVVLGKKRGESKKVSFEKPEDKPKELTQQQKSGNYQAKSGFNFAPAGGGATKQPASAPKASEPQKPAESHKPAEPQAASPQPAAAEPAQRAEAQPEVQPERQPEAQPEQRDATQLANEQLSGTAKTPEAEPAKPAAPAEPAKAEEKPAAPAEPTKKVEDTPEKAKESESAGGAVAAGAATAAAAGAAAASAAAAEEEQRADDEAQVSTPEADTPAAVDADETIADAQVEEQPVEEPVTEVAAEEPAAETVDSDSDTEDAADAQAEAEEAAAAAGEQAASASAALETEPEELEVSEDAEVVEAPAQPQEDIAPAAGRLGKLRGRLSRSQNAIGQGLMGILSAGDLDDDAWEDIEDTLIMADLGTKATMQVTDSLRDKIAERGVSSEEEARAMLREALIEVGHPEMDRSIKAMPNEGKPAVIMVVGVNGTGKTTTTGKLARVLVSMGHNVLLGAADTFRAAAADQLETWGRRVGATTVRGKEGADPASVAFDAVAAGVDQGVDVVLVDTAGRLHTSVDLMDQLGKVKRVVEKKTDVDEVLLVLDATVGQNGLTQARIFRDVVDITGVVLTKLDGTAKGGIVFQVQEELGVPVKLVGLGEGADDLAPFEIEGFVDALLGEK